MPLRHGCNLRKGRASIPGQIYLVTTVTHQRQPIFKDFYHAHIIIKSMQFADSTGQSETLSCVVMPDHLHWLFSLGNNFDLSRVIALVKRRASYQINQLNNQSGTRLWQPGFHDRAIRKEENIKDVARYIIANPLRAGLVDRIADYPFWHAVWL